MANYQNASERLDNYRNSTLNKIWMSTVASCTKRLKAQISAVGSPPKLRKI